MPKQFYKGYAEENDFVILKLDGLVNTSNFLKFSASGNRLDPND